MLSVMSERMMQEPSYDRSGSRDYCTYIHVYSRFLFRARAPLRGSGLGM